MKLIEAMKELKLIEKKMAKNAQLITKYSAQPNSERLYFGDAESQKKEIQSLIQSNLDLAENYVALKIRIERTNLETVIEFHGKDLSLAELLVYKRKIAKAILTTFEALDDSSAKMGLMRRSSGEDRAVIERFYDERTKNDKLREWQDFYEAIDSRLEVVNATTDLVA